jgi:cAMP-specific phosphodiesterase 4
MGLPSAICLECFQKIQDWRRSHREQRRDAKTAFPTPAGSALSPAASAAEAKLVALEDEVNRAKKSGRQLREENDSLLALLEAKDTCIAEFTAEQKKAEASAVAATQSVEQVQQQLRAVTAARAEATKALIEVQGKLSDSQEANLSITEKMDALLEENKILKGRIVKLEGEAAEQRASFSSSAEELTRLRESISTSTAQKKIEMEDTTLRLQRVSDENTQLRQERDAAVSNASTIGAELEKLRQSALAWDAERSAHEENVRRLQAALDNSRKELQTVQQQHMDSAQDADRALASKLAEKQQSIDALMAQVAELGSAVESLQAQRQGLEQNFMKEQETRADLEKRAAALLKEVSHYEEKQQEWNARKSRDEQKMQELEEAVERAVHGAALAQQQQHEDTSKQSEEAAAAEALAAKQQTIDTLTKQLNTTQSTVQSLQDELASAQHKAATLREQLRRVEGEGEATLSVALATAAAEHEETRKLLSQEREANAVLSSRLTTKENELAALQHVHLAAAREAKEELRVLRQHCSAARATYEVERHGWQTSLDEMRSALKLLEKQHAADLNKTNVRTEVHLAADGGRLSHRTGSRWAQPSRVSAIQYPASTVAHEDIPAVTGLERWEFDTKAEAARAVEPGTLVRIGYQIALDWLLFPSAASLRRWVNLLDTVQSNYAANPYHNKEHAADVLQGVYVLVLQCPGLFHHMTKMEKRAVVFAAAVHDIRHPGRTEAFLKNTFDSTYLQFNGLRVLEQMHTATAFELLGHAGLDFTQDVMDDAEALRFHSLVASLIADTHMDNHAALMSTWSRPLKEGGAYDFTKESDRHTVLGMLLHAADIGALSRGIDVALKWLGVVEEMYQQGDEEAALGLPVSPGGDRSGDVKLGQLFFMEMLVIPLFDLIHQLFPAMEAPMQNLRALHAYYSAALKEVTPRPFPTPVQYDAETAQAKATAAAAEAREAALTKREGKAARREKTLEQAVLRLRQATATVAEREAALKAKEAELAAQLEKASLPVPPTQSSLRTEEELLRATSVVMEREEAVQRKAAELERLAAELEEREGVASQLSSQLATIAERVNRRRLLLRYREARVRGSEVAGGVTHRKADEGVRADAGSMAAASPDLLVSSQQPSHSPHRTAELIKLQSALDKLCSAMSFM